MANATVANQKSILKNQKAILASQKAILANQAKLDRVLANPGWACAFRNLMLVCPHECTGADSAIVEDVALCAVADAVGPPWIQLALQVLRFAVL
jgi:hypothetical protein